MRDVISNETVKEINKVIDEILTNIDNNVRNIVGAGNYSLPTIFSYTNYSGQTINVHGSTFRHEVIIDNADGNNLIGDICTVIGDRNGIKLAKAGVEDRHDAFANYWDSTIDIAYSLDNIVNGYVFDMHNGYVGEGANSSTNMSFKIDGLEIGKSYTLTFTGRFARAEFVVAGVSYARICSDINATPYIASVTLEKDTVGHVYRLDFTNNTQSTTLYLNFNFLSLSYEEPSYVSEFIAENLVIAGMNIGIISRYMHYNRKWYPLLQGGGTSDLDAIELTYAEYQALTPAEKTDPDKIYFITDYPSGSGVVINPTGTATDTAETIEVDGTIYDFAGTDADAVHTADIGVAGGVAELDSNGKVPSSQLPSYVDDVVEYASISAFPATGESGKIYIALDTNKTYRWTGSVYVEISPSLALGETSSTAYRGDRGKIAYDHSQSDHSGIAPAFTEASTRANIASGETFATLLGKIKKFFSDLKAVAFSGSYNDLSDTPTIPTVNNGTLTIKQNNTNLGTFTANQSTASNINIECAVPSDVEGSKVVTGNPITITDGSETYTEELSVDLEPIQSGSGTPSPSNIRPIQGYDIVSVDRCGKNLFDGQFETGYYDQSGKATGTGWSRCTDYIKVVGGQDYVLSGELDTLGTYESNGIFFYTEDGSYIAFALFNINALAFSKSVTTPQNCSKIGFYVRSNASIKYIQVEKGSTATTYEPYNGQTVSLQLGNKNLLPMTVEGIKAANSTLTWNGNSATRNGIMYTILTDENGLVTGINANGSANAESTLSLANCPSDGKQYILNGSTGGSNNTYSVRVSGYGGSGDGDFSFTPTSANSVYIQVINGQSLTDKKFYPMIRDSSVTDATFSPYNPTLGGMVYGGQLILNDDGSAVFVGDKAEIVYDGSSDESWSRLGGSIVWGDYTMYTSLSGVKYTDGDVAPNIKTNYLNAIPFNPSWASYDGFVSKNPNSDVLYTAIKSITTVETWRTYLASNPLQVCYELATPFTIHLSAEQLKLLKGYNYISSNGTTIHLTYQPDNAVGDAVSKAEKYTDRLCKTGVVDTFNLYNGNKKVGSVSLLSNGFKLLYMNSIDYGTMFSMNIPDKYVPKGPYQRAVVCLMDNYANPRIIEIYQNRVIVTEDKFEHGDTYGTGLYY